MFETTIIIGWLFLLLSIGLGIYGFLEKRFVFLIFAVLVGIIGFAFTTTMEPSNIVATETEVTGSTTVTIYKTTSIHNQEAYEVVVKSYYPTLTILIVLSVAGAFFLFRGGR